MIQNQSKLPIQIRLLFAAELALLLCHLLFVNIFPFHYSVIEFFDLDGEGSLPAWFSSFQLMIVAMLLYAFYVAKKQQGRASLSILLGALGFLFLSMDEAASIHERIGTVIDSLFVNSPDGASINWQVRTQLWLPVTGYWMFFLIPPALAVFVVWWKHVSVFIKGYQGSRKVFMGCLLFLFFCSVPDIFYNFMPAGTAATTVMLVEEIGEMASITFVVWGVSELLGAHELKLCFKAKSDQLKNQ